MTIRHNKPDIEHTPVEMKNMNWDDIRLFLTIAELGSFRQAAFKLKVANSTLSRRIEALENSLGTKLFNRQSRGLNLTDAGEEMLKTALPMHSAFDEMQVRLFGQDKVISGHINLTVPGLLANFILLDSIKEFYDAWPEITIGINNSWEVLDLSTKEADIAIRMTNNPGEQLIGRKIGAYCEAAYATPTYLDDFLSSKKKAHTWIFPGNNYQFIAELLAPYNTSLPHEIRLQAQDPASQMRCAEQDLGMVMLPCLMGDSNQNLKRISKIVHRRDVWLLAHKDSRDNKRLQLFREFVVSVFERNQNKMFGIIEN